MKKSILTGVLIVGMLLPTTAQAIERKADTTIKGVWYDRISKSYVLESVDKQGEGFIYELFGTEKENQKLTRLINRLYRNKKAVTYYDDMNTKTIYDDQIIRIEIK